MFSLERFRAEIAQRGVTALAVIPDLDPAEDRTARLLPGLEAGAVNHLFLEAGKEALGRSVIPAVAAAAHAAHDPDFLEPFLVVAAGVLAPSVAVANQIQSGLSAEDRHVQSRENQGAINRLVHRPAHDPPREQVQNDRQIKPSLSGPVEWGRGVAAASPSQNRACPFPSTRLKPFKRLVRDAAIPHRFRLTGALSVGCDLPDILATLAHTR